VCSILTNNIIRKIIISFTLLVFSSFVNASASSTDYRFEHLKISDGLPSSRVHKTFQQSNGFIWFATDAGASRYDGKNFVHYQYNPNGENHISNNYIKDIIEDSFGNIWLATESGINVIYPSGEINSYLHDDKNPITLPSNLIYSLFKDSNNNVWVATDKGVGKFDYLKNNFINYKFENKNSKRAHNINESNHKVFFGTNSGLYFINTTHAKNTQIKQYTAKNLTNNEFITSSYLDNDNNIWYGTESEGFFILNPFDNSVKKYNLKKNDNVIKIYQLGDVFFIASSDNGITLFSLKDGILGHITENDNNTSILTNKITNIFVDQSDLLWVSTKKGVSYYSNLKNGSHIYQLKKKNSSTNAKVYSLTSNNEEIFVATEEWIKKFDLKDNSFNTIENSPSNNKLTSWTIKSGTHNNLWIAHNKGITVYNTISKKTEHYLNHTGNKFSLPNSDFYTILPIDDNQAWITGYFDVGVILFNRKKGIIKQYLNKEDNIYNKGGNYTITKIIDTFGNLWLATTNGLIRINPKTNKIKFFNNNFDNIRITSLSEDNNGSIWATTAEMGLLQITNYNKENITITSIGKGEGIPDLKLKNVFFHNDFLWLTSNNKLFKYNIKKEKFVVFPSLITDLDLVFFEGSIKIHNEIIFIGSNKGLVKFEIDKLKTSLFNPKIHITSIFNGDKDVSYLNNDQNNHFSYNNNNISFTFSVTDYTFPNNNLIKYKLEGFDKEWISAKNIQNTSYTNLDAGNYKFRLKGSNSDGVWSDKEAMFEFTIKQAWWFYALFIMGFFLVCLLIMFVISRYKQMKDLEIRANLDKFRANTDSLTHIPNRFNFNIKLNEIVKNKKNSFAVIFIDLDDFKEINDSMGHAIGDELICLVANRLNSNLNDNEYVCRLGGDEFAILINDFNHNKNDSRINEFHELLNENYFLNGKIIKGSASVGVAICPKDGLDGDSLLTNADIAMYHSKQNGKNNISYFNQKMNDDFNEKTEIRNLLHDAINKNEFSVFFQPKVSVDTEEIISLEALIRWIHPEKGFISPAVFIPESESNGTIIEIGEWVLRESCKQASKWNNQGLLKGSVSVNMSPIQFHHPDIVNVVIRALEDFNLHPSKLEIEITESVFVDNIGLTLSVFEKLREIGVKIALDDFGTGYSSLSYLINFPIDVLKIDRAFVKDIMENPKTEIVIKNIFNLADELKFSVVVEGVETKEQLDVVTQYKCDLIQGYFYSPPVNIKETTTLLENSFKNNNKDLLEI
jgi:diguanylate cyclase (GGDEF)-like protein